MRLETFAWDNFRETGMTFRDSMDSGGDVILLGLDNIVY